MSHQEWKLNGTKKDRGAKGANGPMIRRAEIMYGGLAMLLGVADKNGDGKVDEREMDKVAGMITDQWRGKDPEKGAGKGKRDRNGESGKGKESGKGAESGNNEVAASVALSAFDAISSSMSRG